jgi:hypothetical protein
VRAFHYPTSPSSSHPKKILPSIDAALSGAGKEEVVLDVFDPG